MRSLSLVAGLALAQAVWAQPTPLETEPIESFVGVSWSGIRLGATTDGDLKRQFGVQRSRFRPEAVRVRTSPTTPFHLDALLDGRGESARVTALRLEFLGPAPSLESLETATKMKSLGFYPRQRFEAWSVRVFPARGIALFVLGEPPVSRVAVALLMSPDRLADLTGAMSQEPSDIEQFDPRFSDEELTVEYGRVFVNLSGSNVDFERKHELEMFIEEELMRRSRARFLDYRRGASPALNATVSVSWDARRGTLSYDVSMRVRGQNALGEVGSASSSSRTFGKVETRPVVRDIFTIRRVVEEAREELERNFDAAVRRQRPPTKEQIRNAAWAELTNRATRQF